MEIGGVVPVNWRSESQLDQRCDRGGEGRTLSYRGRVGRQTLSMSVHVTGAIVVTPSLDNPIKGFERASRGSPG
jgi:hypothetical protein